MKLPERTAVIVNPAAGGGRSIKRWRKFSRRLSILSEPPLIGISHYPVQIKELAENYLQDGITRIATFGGDGSFNELLQAVMRLPAEKRQKVSLTYLPGGSSCDFEKYLPLSRDPFQRLLSTTILHVDICKVICQDEEGHSVRRYFINNSSIGVISTADDIFNRFRGHMRVIKRLSVNLVAVMAGIKAILRFQFPLAVIKDQERVLYEGPLSNLTVLKNPHFGGDMHYDLETSPDDGSLYSVYVKGSTRRALLEAIPLLYTGKLLQSGKGCWFRSCSVTLTTSSKCPLETDGEIIGYTPASYSIQPGEIRIAL